MVEEAKVECRVKSFAPRDSVEGHTILAFEGETGEQAAESGGKQTSTGKFVVVLSAARGGMTRCALKGHRQDACGTLQRQKRDEIAVFAYPAASSASTQAKMSGTTIVASDSMRNFGVSRASLPQVIFSLGTAPE